MNKKSPRIALVYDWVNQLGGAERVLLALHRLWPQAPLFTLVHHHSPQTAWASSFEVKTSFLQKLPLAARKHYLYLPLHRLAFESFDFTGFDLVISLTSTNAKAIKVPPHCLHLSYCLTPNRYLWQNSYLPPFLKKIDQVFPKIRKILQEKDRKTAQNPDHFFSISSTVQERIKKHYQRSSDLIYPGINTQKFHLPKKPLSRKSFLLVSRLVPYKNIPLAIKAANYLKIPLTIVGSGRLETALKEIAGPTVKFTGPISDQKLLRLYQEAFALICPQEEDFGLVALEAQASGTPVIGLKKGGNLETIIPQKTGLFFAHPQLKSLIQAIEKFKHLKFSPQACRNNALRFSEKTFMLDFERKTKKIWQKHQKTISW